MLSKDHRLKQIQLSPPRILALSFFIVIIIGTLLLKLPISTNVSISWLDALFTAVSSTTVTGLIVVDTGTVFTTFGQIVIMGLIQIGGLGLMTFAVLIFIILGKKIGLKERILIQEALNQASLGGIIRLVKILFAFTIIIELIAAIILAIRWVPEYGLAHGLFISAFHAVSAFNNAGFSTFTDNLMSYVGDPIVNIVITLLFITGGIGFTVLIDVWKKRRFHDFALHTKLMLVGTLTINVIAMLFIFALEYANPSTLAPLSMGDKLWAAYFQGVTPRTAGFNSLDIGSLTDGSIVLMLLLMFIGAGSASTGSGIKLSTFIVILFAVGSFLRGRTDTVIFERTIKPSTIMRSLAIVVTSLFAVFLTIFILAITEDESFVMLVFEAFSAFGTVGISMGVTPELSPIGKIVIMCLMFLGRVGPLTLAFSLARAQQSNIRYPDEEILTG